MAGAGGFVVLVGDKVENLGQARVVWAGFFLITVFPVLGFIKMSYMRITWAADHFLYLPVLGIIGLAVAVAGRVYDPEKPKNGYWGRVW